MSNEELVFRIQQGGDRREELEQLYKQNRGLIAKVINHYHGRAEEEDLFQEAYFGIYKAAKNWSPEPETPFVNYAAYWVKSVIQRYIEQCGSCVAVPSYQNTRITKYRKAIASFERDLHREPSTLELMDILNVSYAQLDQLRKDALAVKYRSFSEIVGEDASDPEGITLGDTVAAPEDEIEKAIDKVDMERLSSLLWSLVNSLRTEQAEVIRRRFQNEETLKECGSALGFRPEKVRQIEMKALRQLRSEDNGERLQEYIAESAYSLGLQGTNLTTWRNSGMSSTERAAFKMMDKGL